jgi:hypothetical protein
MLANEVHDAPPPIALLHVGNGERCHLGPSEPAAQQHGQDRAITQSLGRGHVWSIQELLRLLDGEPVS